MCLGMEDDSFLRKDFRFVQISDENPEYYAKWYLLETSFNGKIAAADCLSIRWLRVYFSDLYAMCPASLLYQIADFLFNLWLVTFAALESHHIRQLGDELMTVALFCQLKAVQITDGGRYVCGG